jgi:WD40 repeat protein
MQGHRLPSADPPLARAASERSPRSGRRDETTSPRRGGDGGGGGGASSAGPSLSRARSERSSLKKVNTSAGESSGGEGGDQLGDLDILRQAISQGRSRPGSRKKRGGRGSGGTQSPQSQSAPDVREGTEHPSAVARAITSHSSSRPAVRSTSLSSSTTSMASLNDDAVTQFKTKSLHSEVKCIAYTAGGGSLAIGCADASLQVWSSNDFSAPLHTFVGHTDACVAAAFTSGGSKLASGSWDRSVRVWDTTTGKQHLALLGHQGRVTSVVFSDSGEWLVSGA